MNQKTKRIRMFVVALLVSIGILPWCTMYPTLGHDVEMPELRHLPLYPELVAPQAVPVIELNKVLIASTPTLKMRRLHRNRQYVQQHICRWHEHSPESGIRVCEYGNEISYPLVRQ